MTAAFKTKCKSEPGRYSLKVSRLNVWLNSKTPAVWTEHKCSMVEVTASGENVQTGNDNQ